MSAAPLDQIANELRYLILAIQAEGERQLNDALRARGLDLTATQSEVLEVLFEAGSLSQGELGEQLVCTKGNISRLIDRMVAKELIERRSHPEDRRRVHIALTPRGRQLIESAFDVISDLLEAIRGLYTDEELSQLNELLSRLSRAFGMRVENRFDPNQQRSPA